MRKIRLKLIAAIALGTVAFICVSMLVRLDIIPAVACFLFLFLAPVVVSYRVNKKRSQPEAHTELRPADGEISDPEHEITAAAGGDITSSLADDPSYHKMIDMFVNDLPNRLKEMQEALDEGDLQNLALKVHVLKGLGTFAGFPIYTEKAKMLERAVLDNQVDQVRLQLDEMVRLCLKTKLPQP
jgi:HPt (histidine-containing phosphotransfer) domain-containing protein